MTRKIFLVFLSCLVFWGLSVLKTVSAAPPDNFTCKLYFMGMALPMAKMGPKTRLESFMFPHLVTLTFHDQKKSINMNTKNKTYFEHSLRERIPSLYSPNVVIDKKKVGQETVDGHPCLKYNAVFYSKDKPQEKYEATLWEAQDLGGLLIKHEIAIPPERRREGGPEKFVTELKEIKIGAAKASMFEVPKDYKKVSSSEEVMGTTPGVLREMGKSKREKAQ